MATPAQSSSQRQPSWPVHSDKPLIDKHDQELPLQLLLDELQKQPRSDVQEELEYCE